LTRSYQPVEKVGQSCLPNSLDRKSDFPEEWQAGSLPHYCVCELDPVFQRAATFPNRRFHPLSLPASLLTLMDMGNVVKSMISANAECSVPVSGRDFHLLMSSISFSNDRVF